MGFIFYIYNVEILVITNDPKFNSSLYLERLSDFAFSKDIEIKYGLESGRDFILNKLIQNQKHIDFIIISRKKEQFYWDYENDSSIDEFAFWLRELDENYSDNNFKISSIPLILDYEKFPIRDFFEEGYINEDFDLVTDIKNINDHLLLYHLGKPINHWINRLGDELDRVDLDTQFDFGKSLVPQKSSFDTKILSHNFFMRLEELKYPWIGENIERLYVDADMFKNMIDRSDKNRGLRNEKNYHSFFCNNLGLILGEHYSSTVYENHFYYSRNKKYVEPDFLNLPYVHSFYSPQIFEVKLPNQNLMNIRKQVISRYFKKSIEQVGVKYLNYFNDIINNREQIIKGINRNDLTNNLTKQKFSHQLLIGRQQDKEENQGIIDNYLVTQNYKVDIITYDELLNKYQMTYNRVNRFGLK